MAALSALGVIFGAVYMLWMFQRVMFGPVTHAENAKLSDLTFRERLVFAPLLLLIFWIGVFPQPFLDRMQPALDRTLAMAADRYEAVTGSVASWGGGLNAHDARKLFPVKVKIVPQGTQAGSGAHAPPTPPATGSGH